MPQEGSLTITVKKEIYSLAQKLADKENRSVANYVTNLILRESKK